MKINKKLIVMGILCLTLFLVLFKYIFAGTLSWKTYTNSEVNYSFKYPSNWYFCEEIYSKLDTFYVHVSDKKIDCSNITFDKNSKYTISLGGYTGDKTNDTDIKKWIENYTKEIEVMRKKEKENKQLPTTGVQEWKFIKNVDNLMLSQKTNTIALVENFYGGTQYLILDNGYVYSLNLTPTTGIETLPIKLILNTLKFK